MFHCPPTNLVIVSNIGNFNPQVLHQFLVVGQTSGTAVAFAFHNAGSHSHALEIVFIEHTIVVDI